MAEKPLVWIYVDGVCDLFHPGHLAFFRKARALGDRLVVGLHSNEEVATYKPAPIMSFAERLAMVAACSLVDRVVPEPVPLRCTLAQLDKVGADFVCHADDMSPEQRTEWYGPLVTAGRLCIVPYTNGVSSREIIERVAGRLKAGTLRVKL